MFRNPERELARSDIAREENLPVRINRWDLEWEAQPEATAAKTSPSLYGGKKSLSITAPGWPSNDADGVVALSQVISADLSDWSYRVPRDHVAVDPVLGRIAFPASQAPRHRVLVSYGYGFASDLGGGLYTRPPIDLPEGMDRYGVWPNDPEKTGRYTSVSEAIEAWRRLHPLPRTKKDRSSPGLLIELMQSGIYRGRFDLTLGTGETIAIVAAPDARPVLWLPDEGAGAADAIAISGFGGGRAVLDGLLIAGGSLLIANSASDIETPQHATGALPLCEVVIRHSTLVPGGALHPNCDPKRPSEPSIVIEKSEACLLVNSSIVGAIQVNSDARERGPTPIVVRDSIVDATSDERTAIGGGIGQVGFANVSVIRSTVVGRVAVNAVELTEDAIFTGLIEVARRQIGCMRFSYVRSGSRTPPRYHCQPDAALLALEKRLRRDRGKSITAADQSRARVDELLRVAPRFESARYGNPNYLRLTPCSPQEITRGAHDESEMGVYHDLFEPQRLQALTEWLQQFVPASNEAAVVFST